MIPQPQMSEEMNLLPSICDKLYDCCELQEKKYGYINKYDAHKQFWLPQTNLIYCQMNGYYRISGQACISLYIPEPNQAGQKVQEFGVPPSVKCDFNSCDVYININTQFNHSANNQVCQ